MFRGALSTPTRTDDAAGVLVVGTVLTLCSWTFVPLWLVASLLAPVLVVLAPVALAPALVTRGYFLQVVRGGVRDGNAAGAPSFVRWGVLYRDGLRSALLSLWYLLPFVGLLALGTTAGALVEFGRIDPAPVVDPVAATTLVGDDPLGEETAVDALMGVLGGFAGILAVGYLVVFAYVRPAALAVLAETGRLREAIRPGRALRVALSGSYAAAWILALATAFLGYALAAPFVPLIVGIGLVFAIRIVVHALYGRGAAAGIGASRPADGAAEAERFGPGHGPVHVDESVVSTNRRSGPAAVEASPAVQTGRGVGTFGVGAADVKSGDAIAADERDALGDRDRGGSGDRDRDAPAAGDDVDPIEGSSFEWGPAVEEQ